MDKSNLNKVFIWLSIPNINRLHKQPNGNTVRENGVAVFTPSIIWHYSKNYELKGKHPFSLILCTLEPSEIIFDEFLDSIAEKIDEELLSNVFAEEFSPMILPTGDIFKEEK